MTNNTLSRRSFLTGFGAAGALVVAGAMAGCAPSVATKEDVAAQQTAAKHSWREKPAIPSSIAETIDADVVVVGAGNGGMVAATTAAQAGAKVIVLESCANVACAREAIGALNSKLAGEHTEDVAKLINHASQVESGDINPPLYRTWAEKSGEMIEWMADTLAPLGKENLDNFWIGPALESGVLKKAGTLDELAGIMGFEGEAKKTFLATVERYNQLYDQGEDVDFGKPAYRMSSVTQPPFYAARIAGTMLVTMHGVITDTNSQPLREDGSVVDGLYVCGNDQGGFYPHHYPSNFTGINAGRTATFARIAAKHACGVK